MDHNTCRDHQWDTILSLCKWEACLEWMVVQEVHLLMECHPSSTPDPSLPTQVLCRRCNHSFTWTVPICQDHLPLLIHTSKMAIQNNLLSTCILHRIIPISSLDYTKTIQTTSNLKICTASPCSQCMIKMVISLLMMTHTKWTLTKLLSSLRCALR